MRYCVLCWFIRVVFQVYRLIGATVAKYGIEFVNAMVSLVFFTCVYEDYLFIADIPDYWCYVRDASYEVGMS